MQIPSIWNAFLFASGCVSFGNGRWLSSMKAPHHEIDHVLNDTWTFGNETQVQVQIQLAGPSRMAPAWCRSLWLELGAVPHVKRDGEWIVDVFRVTQWSRLYLFLQRHILKINAFTFTGLFVGLHTPRASPVFYNRTQLPARAGESVFLIECVGQISDSRQGQEQEQEQGQGQGQKLDYFHDVQVLTCPREAWHQMIHPIVFRAVYPCVIQVEMTVWTGKWETNQVRPWYVFRFTDRNLLFYERAVSVYPEIGWKLRDIKWI